MDPNTSPGEPHGGEDIAAKAFHQREPLALDAGGRRLEPDRAFRQPLENLIEQVEALLDLANADPDARIDVAVLAHRELESRVRHRAHRRRPGARRTSRPDARPT